MHARYIAALLVASAASAFASPNPAALEARQGDIVSDIVDGATSIFDSATSRAADVGDAVTSRAGDVGDAVTSHAAGAIQTLTSFANGQAVTLISAGGEAFTLATSGAGVATTVLGSVYTRATGAAGAQITGNSDSGAQSLLQVRSTLLAGAATVVGSALLGAFVIF
ncbi:hypothetical protein EST38_g2928 [Candolleomyces aberdarensis]|uniref:Uncharacterized protein n=1 Tax=Candolleomyces aberdarensis TaxID=2316362 RepID=A0A4Q2DSB2_9AGAR|nr:hypothetical protein EST38_g2928 [Candolleomyces aberdarensis]